MTEPTLILRYWLTSTVYSRFLGLPNFFRCCCSRSTSRRIHSTESSSAALGGDCFSAFPCFWWPWQFRGAPGFQGTCIHLMHHEEGLASAHLTWPESPVPTHCQGDGPMCVSLSSGSTPFWIILGKALEKRRDEITQKQIVKCVSCCLYKLGFFSQRYKRKYLENINAAFYPHNLILSLAKLLTFLGRRWGMGLTEGKLDS